MLRLGVSGAPGSPRPVSSLRLRVGHGSLETPTPIPRGMGAETFSPTFCGGRGPPLARRKLFPVVTDATADGTSLRRLPPPPRRAASTGRGKPRVAIGRNPSFLVCILSPLALALQPGTGLRVIPRRARRSDPYALPVHLSPPPRSSAPQRHRALDTRRASPRCTGAP